MRHVKIAVLKGVIGDGWAYLWKEPFRHKREGCLGCPPPLSEIFPGQVTLGRRGTTTLAQPNIRKSVGVFIYIYIPS